MREKIMSKNIPKRDKDLITIFVLLAIAVFIVGFLLWNSSRTYVPAKPFVSSGSFAKFTSEKEFIDTVSASRYSGGYVGGMSLSATRGVAMLEQAVTEAAPTAKIAGESSGVDTSVERYSETNVQVLGIDEPDIVKTDGSFIYYSPTTFYWGPWLRGGIMPSYYQEGKTFIVNAYPVDELSQKDKMSDSGELLLTGNVLIVLSSQKITGYDTSDYKELWHFSLNDSSILTARLYNSKLYLVLTKYVNEYTPCLIVPMEGVFVKCTDVYYPTGSMQLDTNYFVFEIEPKTGDLDKQISFLAPSAQTTVYMSGENIFVAVSYTKSEYEIYRAFILENTDLFPSKLVDKVKALETYDISEYAKMTELQNLIGQYTNSLSGDEQLTMNNKLNDFMIKHRKELERTRIARISVDGLELKASGEIPGRLLNQFAMDEYDGNLRTAVTIGRWDNSENAVYILNSDLKVIGETEKFGEAERIYSVRFIGTKGYIVTFKETDPFFIMDLSNPEKPEIKGELKIPGYSAYLHPIDDSTMTGIGKESNQVKVSLFDVSDVANPKELDKYVLSEYWSDILNTHHAFLIDKKHEVFFLPGSQGGYIFSYKNDKLDLVKSIKEDSVKRALYINDYMYILTDSKIVVLDENSWDRVKELELKYD